MESRSTPEARNSRVVLVTGASSGLGRATAALLARRGYRVYGTSRQPTPRAGTEWPMLPLEVCSDASVEACVRELLAREGRIDALVNNAGHAFIGAVEETSLQEARAQLETNFFGALRMMLAVLPPMRERGVGHIINVSSLSGAVAVPFLGAYAASKHALEAMSESLAHELRGTALRVTLLQPDGMRTGIGFHHPRTERPDLAVKRRRLVSLLERATREEGNDPDLLAHEVARVIEDSAPPLRIIIGEGAKRLIEARRTLPEVEFGKLLASALHLDTEPATA
ncbi:SDR family NAD(P)-dependent oxidoreductase [Pyxidicoccus fallax]|uniref:SDR family NAD(P)-dependent oxidoreductase n=1 Tax=Pyxidicoccus fallax TaxID=394095 RepID=A0A848LNH3_9BACT|nr:SDR family NAD(P)-dependent oxidoreductase [Pyxidicoccus fallax]NMO19388.1 SDR family NAD(P)-dependent oxidoreductase [Pyxidicoccus fallax]NPC80238.1 SDR family NAD(P)-dependent oxidoreductase [Pyxidicoccus fallax]